MTLPAATILSIGAVTPLGRDLEAIKMKLGRPAADLALVRRVSDELLSDPATSKQLRRADRFVRMASIAALDAASRAGDRVSADRIGLIVTSGFGPHGRGFKFLDGILDCGDADALPTDFSHSVHGAAASYIAGLLDLRGPSLSATDFEIGFGEAVRLAQCWLDQKTCDRVLVGVVEELGQVLIDCAEKILPPDEPTPLGEGAVFLALGPAGTAGSGTIEGVEAGAEPSFGFAAHFGYSASFDAFQILGRLLMGADAPPVSVVDNATTLRPSFARGTKLRVVIGK
jgi:hypothetical protein